MSKTDFGHIVATLRREARNEFDEIMSQNDLADLARIPLITLQKIEQGRQINLKPELVLSLANALDLSSYSRQFFFLASLGLSQREIVNKRNSQSDLWNEVTEIHAQLQIPAYVCNGFGDLILVNPGFLHILGIQKNELDLGNMLCKYNINRIYFSPEFKELQRAMGAAYSPFARRSVFIFKAMTLKLRNHWYFQKILPELNRFPHFREHWQSTAFHDEDISIPMNPMEINSPKWGLLRFVSFPISAMTEETDITLFSYQPTDLTTVQACTQMAEELGTQPIQLSDWFVPSKPAQLEIPPNFTVESKAKQGR